MRDIFFEYLCDDLVTYEFEKQIFSTLKNDYTIEKFSATSPKNTQ